MKDELFNNLIYNLFPPLPNTFLEIIRTNYYQITYFHQLQCSPQLAALKYMP